MESSQNKDKYLLPVSIIIGSLIISAVIMFGPRGGNWPKAGAVASNKASVKNDDVLPAKGFTLPVNWDGLGSKLISEGVIDKAKFEELYNERGGLDDEAKSLLLDSKAKTITITPKNANLVLNLLWALGLGNKNAILENGPMADSQYGGAGQFASTGGWTLANGDPMNHYSKHEFVKLTAAQQKSVEEVSKNIYRPCCDNSTYFPDCNHGMAMLALLELMAAQNVPESEMYAVALKVNSYWFPGTYLNIADFLSSKKVDWKNVDPKELLGKNYSSASGYNAILQVINPKNSQGGGSCSA